MSGLVVGIDLGGTHMQVGVVDASGAIVGRAQGFTDPAAGVAGVCEVIAAKVGESCQAAGIAADELRGVGLAAPGAVDPWRRVVINAPNLGWSNAEPAGLLEATLGVPVALDNDVNAAALAEHRLGAGRGVDGAGGDLLAVWIGTGVGGGLILSGTIYHGAGFTAGEIGHVIVDADAAAGPVELEAVASRTAIARAVAEAVEAGEPSALGEAVRAGERLTSGHLAEASADGDALVQRVVGRAMDRLGVQIASVVTLLSLRRVVLGGGLVEAMPDRLCELVGASVRRHAWPDSAKVVEIVPTALGPDAGLLGAAMVARERLVSQG
ncbi:MAG: ROK family protein [Phycisphaerales bacterium]